MANGNWVEYRLADLCESIDYGYTTSAVEAPIGPKFLRITDIVNGVIDWHNVPHCNIPAELVPRYRLHHGDIVIARTGATTGVSAYISNPPDAVFASYLVRLKIGNKADSRFIAYFLRSPNFWDFMRGVLGDKSAQPNASARTMTQVKLCLPPLPEQRAIAHILGTLDDKIELNRRMNETLEAIAQAIFKSWFVDFDPVIDNALKAGKPIPDELEPKAARRHELLTRAQAEGRAPVLPDHLARLFPDEFEESELGWIPKGWKVGAVGDLGKVICGKTPPTCDPENYGSDVPFVTIPDMHGKVFVVTTEKSLSAKGAATQPSKFIPPYSICVSCIATPGLVALTSELCQTNQQINSVIPSDPKTSLFCYFALRDIGDQICSHGAGGSVVLNLNKAQFAALRVLLPPKPEASTFQEIALPIFQRILGNEREARTLAAIRDALLPKLVSGEIRVRVAEKFLEGTL